METHLQAATRHFKQDMLESGQYWREGPFRGCSVGCFTKELGLDRADHAGYAAHYGFPTWAAMFEDLMFERLAKDGAHREWHIQWAAAIEGVTDWQDARHKVSAVILRVALPNAGPSSAVVQRVIDLHESRSKDDHSWGSALLAARAAVLATGGAEAVLEAEADLRAERSAWVEAWGARSAWEDAWDAREAARAAVSAASRGDDAVAEAACCVDHSMLAYFEIRDAVLAALSKGN